MSSFETVICGLLSSAGNSIDIFIQVRDDQIFHNETVNKTLFLFQSCEGNLSLCSTDSYCSCLIKDSVQNVEELPLSKNA